MHPIPRRTCTVVTLAGALIAFAASTSAQEPDPDPDPEGPDTSAVSREEHEDLRQRLARLRAELDDLRRSGVAAATGEPGAPTEQRLPANLGGIYDKPFARRTTPQAHVGGYFDVEFRDVRNEDHEFRFHRFVPFLYADVHERIKFASEIEIEDGEEVGIEFAFLDVLFTGVVNFRGGVILDPLGKFNLIHDSPINDLTDRPLVSQFVAPTTLREIGVGFYGELSHPTSSVEVAYEAYVTSGFKGLADDGTATFSSSEGLRDGRPSKDVLGTKSFEDNNNAFAGVGRVSVSPFIGTEFGLSAHHGAYDEAGDNDLTITAVDALVTIPQFGGSDGFPCGPIELQGEFAYAFLERDTFARASGVPDDLWGYYLQSSYHFMPRFFTEHAPLVFFPGSTFTFVTRWDQIDMDGDRRRRLTLGLNYRPIESTVIKFDYQFNRGTGTAADSTDDDAFLISLSSYF